MRSRFGLRVMIPGVVLLLIAAQGGNETAAADRVCAPALMVKVVTSRDAPGIPQDHFLRVPKSLYRYGEGLGRVEESLNPETGLHLLIVVAEPHLWFVDRVARKGEYRKDPGPTYFFRAYIFRDPNIHSAFINSLEFGCEMSWLVAAGAMKTRVKHATLGVVDRLEYREGSETLSLYLRSGLPARLEIHQAGRLYAGVQYHDYQPNVPLDRSLFERPAGIKFPRDAPQ